MLLCSRRQGIDESCGYTMCCDLCCILALGLYGMVCAYIGGPIWYGVCLYRWAYMVRCVLI